MFLPPLLQVEDLSISFGAQKAVENLTFSLSPGETLGLVGESGSGKSATSLALLRLLPSTAQVTGSITFAGQNLLSLSEERMRHHRGQSISMIFQEPMTALNPVMTIGRQIAEAYTAHHPGEDRKSLTSRVLASMREVSLPNPEQRLND